MSSDIMTAFWGMTINNYDETDLALVRQGYPDYIRKISFTLERGEEEGTPHIQAWIKLYRQQRMSYMKKMFPRGSFKPLCAKEYQLNAEAYATKLDHTAESPAVIINNPFPDPVVELTTVVEEVFKWSIDTPWYNTKDDWFLKWAAVEERRRVAEKPSLAKFYVSATYRNIKKEYWRSIAQYIFDKRDKDEAEARREARKAADTHTHTHSDEKFSREGGITQDAKDDPEGEGDLQHGSDGDETEGEDHEDGESSEDEGYSESGSSGDCSSDDSEGSGE